METAKKEYILFGWAMKRLLRDKANLGMLEGFLQVLLGSDLHIKEIQPGHIHDATAVSGLVRTEESLIDGMIQGEQNAYLRYLNDLTCEKGSLKEACGEGLTEGEAKREAKELLLMARKLKEIVINIAGMAEVSGPTPDQVAELRIEHF